MHAPHPFLTNRFDILPAVVILSLWPGMQYDWDAHIMPLSPGFGWHADDGIALQHSLSDVRAVICPGKVGSLLGAAVAQKVPHVVLLASAGTSCIMIMLVEEG